MNRASKVQSWKVDVAPSAALPVVLTESALREQASFAPIQPLLDVSVELRPLTVKQSMSGARRGAEFYH